MGARKIRVGDRVRIVNPMIFERCGYPLGKKEALAQARHLYGAELATLVRKVHGYSLLCDVTEYKGYRDALDGLAYEHMKANCFGGSERSIHAVHIPDLAGKESEVRGVKICKTGTYRPSTEQHSYFDPMEIEPAELANSKTHRILILDSHLPCYVQWEPFGRPPRIEDIHCELI